MKKYMIVLLVLATILNCNTSFAQTHAKRHKIKVHHSAGHHSVARHKTPSHHKSTAYKHNTRHHHGKAIARHHKVRGHPVMREQVIAIDNHSQAAVVEIKNGNVYVNDSLVMRIKTLKNEDDKITINYIAPLPAANNSQNAPGGEGMKPALGVYTCDYFHEGAMIEDMTPRGPADAAGLYPGDVIMKINDKDIENPQDLADAIGSYKPGDSVSVGYLHFGRMESTEAALAEEKYATRHDCTQMEMHHACCPGFCHGAWRW